MAFVESVDDDLVGADAEVVSGLELAAVNLEVWSVFWNMSLRLPVLLLGSCPSSDSFMGQSSSRNRAVRRNRQAMVSLKVCATFDWPTNKEHMVHG